MSDALLFLLHGSLIDVKSLMSKFVGRNDLLVHWKLPFYCISETFKQEFKASELL